jgi:hypothetical protein
MRAKQQAGEFFSLSFSGACGGTVFCTGEFLGVRESWDVDEMCMLTRTFCDAAEQKKAEQAAQK